MKFSTKQIRDSTEQIRDEHVSKSWRVMVIPLSNYIRLHDLVGRFSGQLSVSSVSLSVVRPRPIRPPARRIVCKSRADHLLMCFNTCTPSDSHEGFLLHAGVLLGSYRPKHTNFSFFSATVMSGVENFSTNL